MLLYSIWFLIINLDITFLLLAILSLIVFKRPKLSVSFVCLLACLHFISLGKWGIYYLENKVQAKNYFKAKNTDKEIQGFVYLGGDIKKGIQEYAPKGHALYNEAGPRLIEFAEIAIKRPELPIIVTGTLEEAGNTAKVLQSLNLKNKVSPYANADSTVDNAQNTLITNMHIRKRTWVIVTSAFHMYRSIKIFSKNGWEDLIPYPVNYFFGNLNPFTKLEEYFDGRNLTAWKVFSKELAGIMQT